MRNCSGIWKDKLIIQDNRQYFELTKIIITNWYRKNTDSGRFLNFFSKHPTHQKIGVIKDLADQAILLSDKKKDQFYIMKLIFTK